MATRDVDPGMSKSNGGITTGADGCDHDGGAVDARAT
jgi:hypothetical protein